MTPLYTSEEFNIAKSQDKLPFKCEYCEKTFYKEKKYITYELKVKNDKIKFCSTGCTQLSQKRRTQVKCLQCGKIFAKGNCYIKASPNNFCCKTCSATYNNKHKTKGTRRSKLEKIIEEKLSEVYPQLQIDYNQKSVINSELDIYIPSLKLAIELNGIYHYEPIYEERKLSQIQNNDQNKFQQCQKLGISLCVINTAEHAYVTKKTSQKYIDVVIEVIEKHISYTVAEAEFESALSEF